MPNSSLTRYQSAPSSYFSSFFDGGDEFLIRPPSPETERIFEQFLKSTEEEVTGPMEVKLEEGEQTPLTQPQTLITPPQPEKQSSIRAFYQQQQLQNQKPGQVQGISYGAAATANAGIEHLQPQPQPQLQPAFAAVAKAGGGGVPNLIRHSSSPAGLFDTINMDNGYMVMRGMGDLGDNKAKLEPSLSKPPPSPKTGKRSSFGSPWENPNPSSSAKDRRTLSGGFDLPETKNVEGANRPPRLSHHMSLPKSRSEMSEIEKILQLSDSVPCKIRAKRGCATHPRSIAERVRRTKISERMKRLQDLVPNMDKQTNTADMLDLAVDYIKDLQERVKTRASKLMDLIPTIITTKIGYYKKIERGALVQMCRSKHNRLNWI